MWSLLGILHNTENEEAGVTFNNVDESYTQNGEWKKKKKAEPKGHLLYASICIKFTKQAKLNWY